MNDSRSFFFSNNQDILGNLYSNHINHHLQKQGISIDCNMHIHQVRETARFDRSIACQLKEERVLISSGAEDFTKTKTSVFERERERERESER